MQGPIQNIQKGMAMILASYIDTFLLFCEFYNNNTKFQRKRGGRGPLGHSLNPPVGVDGCCSSLLFSISARASFKMDTTSVTFFAILFWPLWGSCNEGGKSWLIAVLYIAQNDATTKQAYYDASRKRLERKKTFTTRRKANGAPKKTVRWNERGTRQLYGTYATRTRIADNNLKNNFRNEEVFAGPWKVSINFAQDLTPYPRVCSITSRCSGNEPALRPERAAEIEPTM